MNSDGTVSIFFKRSLQRSSFLIPTKAHNALFCCTKTFLVSTEPLSLQILGSQKLFLNERAVEQTYWSPPNLSSVLFSIPLSKFKVSRLHRFEDDQKFVLRRTYNPIDQRIRTNSILYAVKSKSNLYTKFPNFKLYCYEDIV